MPGERPPAVRQHASMDVAPELFAEGDVAPPDVPLDPDPDECRE